MTTPLGSYNKPAVVRVQTEERALEITRLCNEHEWIVFAGIEPEEPKNIDDVNWLLKHHSTKPKTYSGPMKIGPNDYCSCGSGLKYKHNCSKKSMV